MDNTQLKIATHDSATGEKGHGLLSWLLTPFARTQSKTIKQQYEAGCRMFDIRVRKYGKTWRCAHGLWRTRRTAEDILRQIDAFEDKCYVTITYEGSADNVYDFTEYVNRIMQTCTHTVFGGCAVKYGKGANVFKVAYDYIMPYPKGFPDSVSKFVKLDGHSWHILLPIPWLWKKIYYDCPMFNIQKFTYVDFL